MRAQPLLVPSGQRPSAAEVFAADFEVFQISENRQGNLAGVEKRSCDGPDVLRSYGLNTLHELIKREEMSKVHLLPRQIGHTARGRLQPKHQGTFEVILGPAKFL